MTFGNRVGTTTQPSFGKMPKASPKMGQMMALKRSQGKIDGYPPADGETGKQGKKLTNI